jgi:hypothetical protein
MERFTMVRHTDHEHCGLESDPEGAWVPYKAAMLYGFEQFGLGRLDGQADVQAVTQILKASNRPDPMTLRLD